MTSRGSQRLLRRSQRMTAIELARGYRTVSYEAAGILAGQPSLELLARMYAELYAACGSSGGMK